MNQSPHGLNKHTVAVQVLRVNLRFERDQPWEFANATQSQLKVRGSLCPSRFWICVNVGMYGVSPGGDVLFVKNSESPLVRYSFITYRVWVHCLLLLGTSSKFIGAVVDPFISGNEFETLGIEFPR